MSETYVTYRVWDGCKAPINLEYSGRLIGQIVRESTIDRDALLTVADELDERKTWSCTAERSWSRNIASRIREALGVQDA